MNLRDLLPVYAKNARLKAMERLLAENGPKTVFCEGLCASSLPFVLATLSFKTDRSRVFLCVLDDEESAGYFYQDLVSLLDKEHVFFFPSSFKRAVRYARRDVANELLRTEVTEHLANLHSGGRKAKKGGHHFVITYPSALAERVAARDTIENHTLHVGVGQQYDLTELSTRLIELGFRRTDYVYEPGDFAVRGGLLDVYSYASELPYRIDFFGDEVESIRTFQLESQLSEEIKSEVSIISSGGMGNDGAKVPFSHLIPEDTIVLTRSMSDISLCLNDVYENGFSHQAMQAAAEEGNDGENYVKDFDKTQILAPADEIMGRLEACRRILLRNDGTNETDAAHIVFNVHPQPVYHKDFDLVRSSFSDFTQRKYSLYILADSEKQLERLQDILQNDESVEEYRRVAFVPVKNTLHEGFYDDDAHVCFFTDHQIFDRYHQYSVGAEPVRNGKMALTLKELREFQIGDFVVHIDHGVGQFLGLVRMPSQDGTLREVIKIGYKNNDMVYVSIHALHKVSKYKGRDGEPPRLSQLGTGAWDRIKERTKNKIKDIARDLIRLYSQRKQQEGFQFSRDSFLQQELEAGFAYEDTPDQNKVTREVKEDMESNRPMDRLVCGDVGFGKTEVAVRAAFKAACDNKQVAVLVPTTVLALQHYNTFRSRLKNFPVTVDYLTRARTAKQTKELLENLAAGKTDIVIGTHRLIGKNVKFKELGLLIIDEEQKFGVAVKEKLRQMKVNVDTLTMSATPIPRTLQFSLMGARDFSVMQTPPPNRFPIQTEVLPFSHEVIADAIGFELSRNGQVFFVTNRVAALPNLKALVEKYVPNVRVAVGHGQMPPEQLERTVIDFINHEYDVLISTTIVENGIDIPNANTIIVDAAHTFGLSDLHQMRGRVGRSNRKAFCFLLSPPLSLLKDDARRRLQAIETFSDLGSGINIAMQDLEIRGAGNLLGAEQSGFIADLGFEAYQKILGQALSELKTDEFAELYTQEQQKSLVLDGTFFVDDCSVETDTNAYFPETYVPGATERMLLYRELDNLKTQEEVQAFRLRMLDRFGEMPTEGEELLCIVPLRTLARKCGVERLSLHRGKLILYFVSQRESTFYQSETFGKVIDYAMNHLRSCKLDENQGKRRMIVASVQSMRQTLEILRGILGE